MGYRERAEEIAAVLDGLGGSGVVHPRSRNTPNWAGFVQLFRDGDVINGWQLTRRRGEPQSPRWGETYLLTKIRGVHDASLSEFGLQDNLDEAVQAFRDGPELSFGHVADGLKINGVEERMFGDVLCHVAECELTVSLYYADL